MPMTTISPRHAAPALAALLIAAAAVSGQTPAKSGDIDQYRKYYLPPGDEEPQNGAVKVTFLGTATLLFDDGETQLMIDGFLSRPSLLHVIKGKMETDKKVVDAALKRAKVD